MADEADLAGNEHHRAMRFCRQERRGSACQVEACRQVHIDDACPVGAVGVDRCQQLDDAGAGHNAVKAAKPFGCVCNRIVQRRFIGHICLETEVLRRDSFEIGQLLRCLDGAADPRAFGNGKPCCRQPDP